MRAHSSKNRQAAGGGGAEEGERWAYVSLLYGDEFLLGLRVLGQSLQESGTQADRVALLAGNVRQNTISTLEEDGWKVWKSQIVHNPGNGYPTKFSGVYTKLRIFGDRTYERIIFLDADTIVMRNIDSLFLCDGFCAVLRHSERFNSGVMALQPSVFDVDDMLSHIKDMPSYTGGDQGFLNTYLKEFAEAPMFYPEQGILLSMSNAWRKNTSMEMGRLPTAYNADLGLFVLNKNRWAIDDIHVIHYTLGPVKPWAWWSLWVLGQDAMSPWLSFRQALPGGHSLPCHTPSLVSWMHLEYTREWYVCVCAVLLGIWYRHAHHHGKRRKMDTLPGQRCALGNGNTSRKTLICARKSILFMTAYGLVSVALSAILAFHATPQQLSPWTGCTAFYLLFTLIIIFLNDVCLRRISNPYCTASTVSGEPALHSILTPYGIMVALFVYPVCVSISWFSTIWSTVVGLIVLEGISVFLYLHLLLPWIAMLVRC